MSFSFLLAALVLALTPGPAMTYMVARTLAGGRREGMASAAGAGLGGFVHVVAAALGLSLIVAQSATAFGIVKYAGAAYLLYLGIRTLRARPVSFEGGPVGTRGTRRAFVEGLLVEATNVKTALFFLAFLPQFTQASAPLAPQLVLLGSVCVLLNTLTDVGAVLGAHRLVASGTARDVRARVLTRVSGWMMVGLGSFLALARRAA